MAELIATAACCNGDCSPVVSQGTPGTPGENGENGTNGTDGVNAYSVVANMDPDSQPEMPAEGDTVTVTVTDSTDWMVVGNIEFVQFWGWLQVVSVPSSTTVELLNLQDTASAKYMDNAAPGTPLPAAAKIGVGGMQGPEGNIAAGTYLEVAKNLNDLDSSSDARNNLELGDVAVLDEGTANGEVPKVDNLSGLTSGEALFATASGIESKSASNARSALGLGTMATQNANAVSISGGAIDGVPMGVSTPAAVKTTDLTVTTKTFNPSSAIQTLATGTTVSPNATKIRVVGNGGAVLLTATPTITNPVADGQQLLIMGTDDTNTVEFQDNGSLVGSKLQLGSTSRILGKGDILHLLWDQADGFWYEVSFASN